MEQQGRAPDLAESVDEMDELAPLNPHKITSSPGSAGYTQTPSVEWTLTESTLYEPGRMRAETSPSSSSEDASEFEASKSYVASSSYKIAPGMDLRSRPVGVNYQGTRSMSLSSKASGENSVMGNSGGHSQRRLPTSEDSPDLANNDRVPGLAEKKKSIVDEVVADAKRQLITIREREQSSRPLKIVSPDPDRMPDPALCALFQKSANDELQIRRLNARDWLRVATWWLLKVLPWQFCHGNTSKCTPTIGQEYHANH